MSCYVNDTRPLINQYVTGELTLDLSRMPRGSTNSKNCTLKLLEPQIPTINLFKVTRTRGWWPFARSIDAGRYIQAVKYHKRFCQNILDKL